MVGRSTPRVTVHVASKMATDAPSILIRLLPPAADSGISAQVTVVGNVSLPSIQQAVAAAAEQCHLQSSAAAAAGTADDALPAAHAPALLPCDTVEAGDGATSLVFGLSDAGRAAAVASRHLYAAHHSVWSNSGVARAWGGVAVADGAIKLSKGDLSVDGVSAMSGAGNNLAAGPKTILFVDEGASGVAALSAEGALERLGGAANVKALLEVRI